MPFNPSFPSATYMRQWVGSVSVKIMASCLFDAKPLYEPILGYCQLNPKEQTSVKLWSNYKHFHSRKWIWKYCLRNGGHFVLGEMSKMCDHWFVLTLRSISWREADAFCSISCNEVIKWKHFLRYWPFAWGIHRSPVNSHTKASDAELWCFRWSEPRINGWVNNRAVGDLRRHQTHYDFVVMLWVLWTHSAAFPGRVTGVVVRDHT